MEQPEFPYAYITYGSMTLSLYTSHCYLVQRLHTHMPYCQPLYHFVLNGNTILSDSEKYRSIALGSIAGKLFDNVILYGNIDVLQSSCMQFGFKPEHSTTHDQCTFMLQETIEHYVSLNAACYVILLDASKAFDRVQQVKPFVLLYIKGLCPVVVKLLITMYTHQEVGVRWNT